MVFPVQQPDLGAYLLDLKWEHRKWKRAEQGGYRLVGPGAMWGCHYTSMGCWSVMAVLLDCNGTKREWKGRKKEEVISESADLGAAKSRWEVITAPWHHYEVPCMTLDPPLTILLSLSLSVSLNRSGRSDPRWSTMCTYYGLRTALTFRSNGSKEKCFSRLFLVPSNQEALFSARRYQTFLFFFSENYELIFFLMIKLNFFLQCQCG